MAILVTVKGPHAGRQFAIRPEETIIGRQSDSTVCLEAREVSRHHARITLQEGSYVVEDLGSINHTYVNGRAITGPEVLTERDTLQIGPYVFAIRPDPAPTPTVPDTDLIIRSQLSVSSANWSIYDQGPAHKLQVVLEIAQHLAGTLDVESLVNKLLDDLMCLFPQADRGMILLGTATKPTHRIVRTRGLEDASTFSYSRTIVEMALEKGVGIFSEDMRAEPPVDVSESIRSLNLRSMLCVPLICHDGRRLGVIQLDRCRSGMGFREDDLHLLTAVGLQVTVVLDNAALHAQLLREERLRQELAVAREIQQGFLPTEFPSAAKGKFDLFARVYPARHVSGDLYDFFPLNDGRLAFFVGDVSGKGMPAALFMVMVRTLNRHLATAHGSPAETLARLNASLAADNPSCMFVTLAHGIYTPATGEVVLVSGGHPLPLLRRADGQVEQVEMTPGRLLGFEGGDLRLREQRLHLKAGETLVLYTDGFTEARDPETREMFGLDRFREALGGSRTTFPLATCAEDLRTRVERFTRTADLQDDLTLLLLRQL